MEEDFKYLELIKDPSIAENFAKKLFMAYLNVSGVKTTSIKPKLNQNNENYETFRVQSCFYEENGEKIYRNVDSKDKLIDFMEGIETLCDLIRRAIQKHGDSPFLGVRPLINEQKFDDQSGKSQIRYEFGEYQWITYSMAKTRIDNLSHLFIQHGFNLESKLAIFANTSPTWFLSAHALFQIRSPVVTIYSSMSTDNIQHVLNLTKSKGIFVDNKSLARILPMISVLSFIRVIFCASDCIIDSNSIATFKELDIDVVQLSTLDLDGALTTDKLDKIESCLPKAEDLAFVMFTSGSTGISKGVMLTHHNIVASVSSIQNDKNFITGNETYFGYLPLAHILEFIGETGLSAYGNKIGYGSTLTMFDTSPMIIPGTKGDLTALKPTFLTTVPLLLERVKTNVLEKIKTFSRVKQIIFQTAYNVKLNHLRAGLETPLLDKLIFNKIKKIFGGKLTRGYVGGAMLNRDTEDFMHICFALFKQGYGLTETCSVGSLSNLDYWRSGGAGPVTVCAELKFIPWEDAGYFPNDPSGPKGEILLSGKFLSPGYYENEETTNEVFVRDEKTCKTWFKTGDIGALLPDGTLRIIDRKKDIVKFKHGEYISLVFVESIISKCELVDMVFVCPNTSLDFLVAFVIPSRESVKKLCTKNSISETSNVEDMIKNSIVCELIEKKISETLNQQNKLNKYEIPKKIVIVSDLWTPESGLLTPSAKLRRTQLAEKYTKYLI